VGEGSLVEGMILSVDRGVCTLGVDLFFKPDMAIVYGAAHATKGRMGMVMKTAGFGQGWRAVGVGIWLVAQGLAPALAMDINTVDNALILSGPVTGAELNQVKDALAANPKIDLVVLRNSPGGDAWTGYRVGEFFRDKGLTTAVSGYCISSCSRMFLGGKQRLFTDDFPAARTFVGFHGHYDNSGNLDRASVSKGGLYQWIIRHSDGKADPDLVSRWIAIEKSGGAANFMHPDVAATLGHSVFFCDGVQNSTKNPAKCEPLVTNALERGVITDVRRISSPDKATLPNVQKSGQWAASGYAALTDLSKLPIDAAAGQQQYQRYLQAPVPRAFAVAPTRQHWGWVSNSKGDVADHALKLCAERAKQACVLYSVDDLVVYAE
jgi:hypothetical protein